jgi:hypothetical protein
MLYPLKGRIGVTPTQGATEVEVSGTYGGFTLPIMNGKLLVARRDDKPTISYPGWLNCLGGGAGEDETSPDIVIGREFTEESMCSLGRIVGRAGRPLRAVLGKPKKAGDPVSIDTAEAWLVEFTGEPQMTDESREFVWLDFAALRTEEKIVGRDVTPFGRTMLFVLWGVSLAQDPFYDGPVSEEISGAVQARLVPSPNFSLICDDRYLVHVSRISGRPWLQIWHNLSLAEEANEQGILPNGPLAFL